MKAAGPKEGSRIGEIYHGGDLSTARLRFPRAPRPWLDLSTGINPIAYPFGDVSKEAWARLPEASAIRALEGVAAKTYGARESGCVIAAPGAQALIQLLPRLLPARRVGILGFTYAEHEAAWRAAGASVEIVHDLASLDAFELAIVVNPNNPDGRLLPPQGLIDVAARLTRKGGVLLVDEAFIDAAPLEQSLAPILPPGGVIVLRSFGKFFGLAGMRLGFAIAPSSLVGALRSALGPWAISGAAVEIGRLALADTVWREDMMARLAEGAARLDAVLERGGFEIVGGTPLFRLARHPRAGAWFERLARRGIWVRPFPGIRADWLRFGLPGSSAQWRRLEAALGLQRISSTTS
jgi:cobalamin biosynthetic protein CobC